MAKISWMGCRVALISAFILLIGDANSSPSHGGGNSILVSNFSRSRTDTNGVPKGWSLKVWRGRPDLKLVVEGGAKVLRLRSAKSAVSLYRNLKVNLKNYPILTWKWKVTRLPENADARLTNRDDQAAGLYVIFPKFPSFINSEFIGYIWETSAPVGSILANRKNPRVRYIVVRSGPAHTDEWITETRDVYADYRKVFGKKPSKAGGFALMIDSDDTRSVAESYFGRIEINRHQAARLAEDTLARNVRPVDSPFD